ncbi:MAG TPA: SMC-Scp complex subunit ScpB [Steroidobacteraceae bacterium]|nr:SMC-Scp complex subunit ScpB [Steroidobacteraceae bacterium]
MSDSYVRNAIEAALLAAGRPLQLPELLQLFEESRRPEAAAVQAALEGLSQEYAGRALELKHTAGGYRVQVRQEFAAEVSRLWPERPARYSRALLETLALIAYRQPITRGEIEAVRGVAVNQNIIKTLLERNWVRVVGTRDVPGRPELLGTTREFLDYFGLSSLDELPPLAELKALADMNVQLDLPSPLDRAAAPGGMAAEDGTDPGQAAADGDAAAEAGRGTSGGPPADAAADTLDALDAPAASRAGAAGAVSDTAGVIDVADLDALDDEADAEDFGEDDAGAGAAGLVAAPPDP